MIGVPLLAGRGLRWTGRGLARGGRGLWRWWNTPWMARWGRMLVFHGIAFLLWWYQVMHPGARNEDGYILLYIVASAVMVAATTTLGVLWITRAWTLRAAGIVGFAMADATLYLLFANGRFRWFQPEAWMTDFARTYFVVGLTVLNAGMLLWLARLYLASREGKKDHEPP